MPISVDLELTNRCNAKCHFCPRDATPHQGLMTPEVFDRALDRAIDFRSVAEEEFNTGITVSLCGLGEPLLNRHAAEFARKVTDAGIWCTMSSNGALLDERRGRELLDAGLKQIFINVGDTGADYEEVYRLPWEKTRANVERFVDLAGDDCEVCIVLVDYKRDPDHLAAMRRYWEERGVSTFQEFEIMNRGGSLFVDHMQYEALPQLARAREMLTADGSIPTCGAPFAYLFVGYDAKYYLCCSDWEKQTPMGTVFDRSFVDVTREKLRHVADRQVVCRTCNLDPTNQLTEALAALDAGEIDDAAVEALVATLRTGNDNVIRAVEKLDPAALELLAEIRPARRTIPVTAV